MDNEHWMKFHELQALWWMHAASNGHAATRIVHKGGLTDPLMTTEELRDDAMKTAQHHLHLYMHFAEQL